MQIINDPSRAGSLAGAFGSGLNQLAELKLAELTKRYDKQLEKSQFTKTWEPILGKHSANFLSNLSPDERKNAMQDIGSLLQLNEPVGSADQARGMQSLGMAPQQQMPDQQQNFLQDIQNRFTNQTVGQRPQDQEGSLLSGLMQSQPQQPQQQAMQQGQQQSPEQQLTPERAKLIENLFATPEQKKAKALLERENRKEAALARKESHAEQAAADKETKKYFEDALNLEKAADFSDIRLKKMENLIKKGGLPVSGFYSLFKDLEEKVPAAYGAAAGAFVGNTIAPGAGAALGGIIGGLISPIGTMLRFAQKHTSPNLEEFEKLSNDFIKDAKAIFSSRITDADLKAFMATIPTLGQTDAGKLAIINNMRMFNEGSRIRAEAVKDVIRENGNRRPHNLQILVEDRIKPQLDELSQRFSVV